MYICYYPLFVRSTIRISMAPADVRARLINYAFTVCV